MPLLVSVPVAGPVASKAVPVFLNKLMAPALATVQLPVVQVTQFVILVLKVASLHDIAASAATGAMMARAAVMAKANAVNCGGCLGFFMTVIQVDVRNYNWLYARRQPLCDR